MDKEFGILRGGGVDHERWPYDVSGFRIINGECFVISVQICLFSIFMKKKIFSERLREN